MILAQLFEKQLAEGLQYGYDKVGIGIGNLSDQDLLKEYQMTLGYKDTPFDDPLRRNLLIKELDKRGLAYNRGGIIPALNRGGRLQSPDKRDRDSRLFYGTHDEMVINQKMSRLFPGVLDDINYNGGSLYMAMFRSLKEQKKNEDGYEKINEKFKKLLDDIEFKQVKSLVTPPSPSTTPPPPRPQLNPTPQNTSAGITPPSGREGTPGLMVLDPQVMSSTPPATPPPSSGKINNGPPNYELRCQG